MQSPFAISDSLTISWFSSLLLLPYFLLFSHLQYSLDKEEIILVGNKIDLDHLREVTTGEGKKVVYFFHFFSLPLIKFHSYGVNFSFNLL